jgi:hypothetical protein
VALLQTTVLRALLESPCDIPERALVRFLCRVLEADPADFVRKAKAKPGPKALTVEVEACKALKKCKAGKKKGKAQEEPEPCGGRCGRNGTKCTPTSRPKNGFRDAHKAALTIAQVGRNG